MQWRIFASIISSAFLPFVLTGPFGLSAVCAAGHAQFLLSYMVANALFF